MAGLGTAQPSCASVAPADADARVSDPWGTVVVAERAAGALPGHAGSCLDLARAYAGLGLRTLAAEQIALLPSDARATPESRAVAQQVESLPDDVVSLQVRLAVMDANLRAFTGEDALRTEIAGERARWSDAQVHVRAFRTRFESIVLREGAGAQARWRVFLDDHGAAAALPGDLANEGSVLVDGLHAPRVLRRLVELTPRQADGFQPGITILCGSRHECFDALTLGDLRGVLSQARVRVLVGQDALARAEARLRSRIELALGRAIAIPGRPGHRQRWPEGGVGRMLERLAVEQREALAASKRAAEVVCVHAAAKACGGAMSRPDPLRVLIPTTRHSTFVRHSAADIADALRAMGHEPCVLIEPDDHARPTTLWYSRAVEAFRPDFVLLINFTRGQLGAAFPANLPIVTWIQDAMAHLFSAAAGKAVGERDYLVGHLHREMFTSFGYPADRMLHAPVVANPRKFHDGPVDAGLLRRHECEVAYVSHQSETPRACRDRLLRAASARAGNMMPAIIEAVYEPACRAAVLRPGQASVCESVRRAVDEAIRAVTGREPEAQVRAVVEHSVARPIAERACRQQFVSWAAGIARRRAWRLHLYGRGWEGHEGLAEFARGELAHGEELRAAYRGARAHLHGGLGTYLHQRVMECALSGGLPLVRVTSDDFFLLEEMVTRRVMLDGTAPCASAVSDRTTWVLGVDHPQAAMLVRLRQKLGLPVIAGTRYRPEFLAAPDDFERRTTLPADATWLLGDWSETTFDSEAGLEALLEKAVHRPAWRESLSRGIAGRVHRALTYETVLHQLFELMRSPAGKAREIAA